MTHAGNSAPKRRCGRPLPQRGYVTLVIGLILVVALTLLTLFAGRVGLLEQQTTTNQAFATDAVSAAELDLQRGIAYIRANQSGLSGWNWRPCIASEFADLTVPPCGDGNVRIYDDNWLALTFGVDEDDAAESVLGIEDDEEASHAVYFLTPNDDGVPAASPMVTVAAQIEEELSEDDQPSGTGRALVKQSIRFYSLVRGQPEAPLMFREPADLGGDFDVIANENSSVCGTQVTSVWSAGDVVFSGNSHSCRVSEADNSGCSTGTYLSDGHVSVDGVDICDEDPEPDPDLNSLEPDIDRRAGFPEDLFEYIFGVPRTEWETIKAQATVVANCIGIDPEAGGFYWITGECRINGDLGLLDTPVLIVSEGDIDVAGGGDVFGVLYGFNSDPAATQPEIHLSGGKTIHGAVVTEGAFDIGAGGSMVRYDQDVLANIDKLRALQSVAIVPGSWADFVAE